jgi:hypothetical protein
MMRLPVFATALPLLLEPLDLILPPAVPAKAGIFEAPDCRPRRGKVSKDWLKPIRNSKYRPHQGQRERDRHRRRYAEKA